MDSPPDRGRNNARENYNAESKTEMSSLASTPETKTEERFPNYLDRKISPDLNQSLFQQNRDFPGSNRTVGFASVGGQICSDVRKDLQPILEKQTKHSKENPLDMHEHSMPRKDLDAEGNNGPLDLSEKSTRADSLNLSFTSTLQAALIVHPCPYCSHKTYYPEVLWMHKRIWHKVSCHSMAPPWILQNGFKTIQNNLVFLARSGRTGPPPVLSGKECQPLPIARFTRTQVPSGLSGSKSNCSGLGTTTKSGTMPKDIPSINNYAPQSSGIDGYRQSKLNHTHEQHSTVAQRSPLKVKYEVSPKTVQAGSFNRSSTPSQMVVSRPSSQPCNSKQTEKYTVPQASATGFASPSKHCTSEPVKAKFLSPPQYHLPCNPEPYITQEDPLVPQPESNAKRENEMRALTNCAAGTRASPPMQPHPDAAGPPPPSYSVKQDPPSGGQEKRLDIVKIFKTYIPKDLATLYQTWGANSPVLDHAGKDPINCIDIAF